MGLAGLRWQLQMMSVIEMLPGALDRRFLDLVELVTGKKRIDRG